jgi:hypothetical protein
MPLLERFSPHPFRRLRPLNQVESNAISLGTNGPVSNRTQILSVDSPTDQGGST